MPLRPCEAHTTSSPYLSRHLLVWMSLLILAWSLGLGACRKNSTPDDTPTQQVRVPPPGAYAWDGAAAKLPARAPFVVVARPAAIMRAADDLYEWLIAEPAMLGPDGDGDERVRQLVNIREGMSAEFGFDLLSLEQWASLGIDLEEPMYFAVAPLGPSSEEFIGRVEAELAERLDVAPDEVKAALERYDGEPMPRLYAELSESERATLGIGSVRLLFEVTDRASFFNGFDAFGEALEWEQIAPGADSGIARLYAWDLDGSYALVAVRHSEEVFTLDATAVDELPSENREEAMREAIREAIDVAGAGLPDAPRPIAEPECAAAMNQDGVSKLIRHATFTEALDRASLVSAQERDSELLLQLIDAYRGGTAWDVGADGLSGLTYEFHVGGNTERGERLMSTEMALFGQKGAKAPGARAPDATLAPPARAIGLSLDPALISGESWKAWLGVEAASKLFYSGEDEGGISSDFGEIFGLPRNILLLIANVDELLRREGFVDFIPIYNQRAKITRVETVIPGLDLTGFMRSPRVLTMIAIDPALEPIERDVVGAALRDTLYYMVDEEADGLAIDQEAVEGGAAPTEEADGEEADGEEASVFEAAQPLTPGTLTTFDVPEGHPLGSVPYYYMRDTEEPFIVFGWGIDKEAMRGEVDALRARLDAPIDADVTRALYMRAEPVGLVQLASAYKPAEWSFIDLNILAQRVGPMLMSVHTGEPAGAPAIQYKFELMAPPSLD